MPTFGTLPIGETRANRATGKRAALLQENAWYIQRGAPGQAGLREPGEGETTQVILRRLTAAAEVLGMNMEVRCSASAAAGLARTRPRNPRHAS